jgi:histone H3/H4
MPELTDSKTEKPRRWIVTRIVRERMESFGRNREEAKDNAVNPFSVEVVRESARLAKDEKNDGYR